MFRQYRDAHDQNGSERERQKERGRNSSSIFRKFLIIVEGG